MRFGIPSGLAAGAAIGPGMVAVEVLMHRIFDGSANPAGGTPRLEVPVDYLRNDADYDMGGDDFGVADEGSWDDDSVGISASPILPGQEPCRSLRSLLP
jgi:hypothetical protein